MITGSARVTQANSMIPSIMKEVQTGNLSVSDAMLLVQALGAQNRQINDLGDGREQISFNLNGKNYSVTTTVAQTSGRQNAPIVGGLTGGNSGFLVGPGVDVPPEVPGEVVGVKPADPDIPDYNEDDDFGVEASPDLGELILVEDCGYFEIKEDLIHEKGTINDTVAKICDDLGVPRYPVQGIVIELFQAYLQKALMMMYPNHDVKLEVTLCDKKNKTLLYLH